VSLPNLAADNKARTDIRSVLGGALRRIRRISPGPVDVDSPICQLFIGGPDKRSVYTLINFPSLFSPASASACSYKLKLYDQDGAEVARQSVTVPPRGTVELRLETIFDVALPEIGLLSAQITAGSWLSYANRHLGPIRAHFYAMYHDAGMRSMAIVHPQSIMWKERPVPESWRSTLVICPDKLSALEIYQINPTPMEAQTEISLRNLDGAPLVSSPALMPPRGTRRISWSMSDFGESKHVAISSEALTAPNAKPLVFQHHRAGFSAGHS
jgi:hypothetical protein